MIETALFLGVTFVAIIAVQIIFENLSYKAGKPDSLDKITLRPGLFSWLMILICGLACIMFGIMTVSSQFSGEDRVFWLLLGTPLSILMGFAAYVISWTRLRVSAAFVEYRGLKGWTQFEWDNVSGLYHNSILGHRLHIKSRIPLPVWIYSSGSREVRELFAMYEKPFEA